MNTISILSVPVSDQQKSKTFYLNMGFQLVTEQPMGNGDTWLQMRLPAGGADISLVTWFKKMPPGSLQGAVILCDNISDEVELLNKRGIGTTKIDETPWGKFSTVNDPDGNSWNLHQL